MHALPRQPDRLPACRSIQWVLVVAIVLPVAAAGCASAKMVELRAVPKSPLVERFKLTSDDGPQASSRTKQFLRVHGLLDDLNGDPRKLLDKVQEIIEREPTADRIYAFTELSYLAAKKVEKKDPKLALDLYGASVLHAHQYLFDRRFRLLRNPYDPHFRGACDLYNGALEESLRLARRDNGLVPGSTGTIQTASGEWNITVVLRGSRWNAEDFERFEFCSDYKINGLKNHYQNYGLGVPLIAVRRSYEGEPEAARYYPQGLSFPVTAFIRPLPGTNPDGADAAAQHQAVLEFYDPLATNDIAVDDLYVPLESDLTTPLAYFLSNPAFGELGNAGLFNPEKLLDLKPGQRQLMGLYMVQPYESGKIPVVMVHGLWSSPMTWMEMFNDLRSSPEIREHYQFWFYLYPTAQPFWISAAMMRRDLAEARRVLDPEGQEAALDQTVLIGHSMGGLVSRLQTLNSREDFWQTASSQPFQLVKAETDIRTRLEQSFFFTPNPSVRRVITIGTPHRGSKFSNGATQWLTSKLITMPQIVALNREDLFQENKDLLKQNSVLKINTSIDSLSPESPFFPAMLAAERAPWVKYHNIIGLVPEEGVKGWLASGTDGVVARESAHMDDVESEITVPADHTTVHSHPLAVLEVRRILLEHLNELRHFPGPPPKHVQQRNVITASRPEAAAPDTGPAIEMPLSSGQF